MLVLRYPSHNSHFFQGEIECRYMDRVGRYQEFECRNLYRRQHRHSSALGTYAHNRRLYLNSGRRFLTDSNRDEALCKACLSHEHDLRKSRAHETTLHLVCRLLLEKNNQWPKTQNYLHQRRLKVCRRNRSPPRRIYLSRMAMGWS